MNDRSLSRRRFIRQSAALTLATGAAPALFAIGANERLRVAVIGLSRGSALAKAASSQADIEVATLCDVDSERIARAQSSIAAQVARRPQETDDLRTIVDDRAIDAVMIATCNHWHAPAAILALKAGKQVYVEKPGSHNGREAELLVEAAIRHGRTVQLGTQRRTWPGIREGIQRLHEGVIGTVRTARCFYTSARGSIGKVAPSAPPANLNYALWQGPAPERPYKTNVVHYNWHWHWHWGGGELANNGVHALDVARWGLRAGTPKTVSYVGGRYHHDDDQETPDTGVASFEFGAVSITWDGSSCHTRKGENCPFVAFYGDGGRLEIRDPGYVVFDMDGKEIGRGTGPGGDVSHVRDFADAIRDGRAPNAVISEGQKAALLCHLGNIAYRTRSTLAIGADGRPEGAAAMALWEREYREGQKPVV